MTLNDVEFITVDQLAAIRIKEGEFEGVVFRYGEVSFPDPDQPILSFEYFLMGGELHDLDVEAFRQEIGDLLVQIIQRGLERDAKENDRLLFRGGT